MVESHGEKNAMATQGSKLGSTVLNKLNLVQGFTCCTVDILFSA